MRKAMGKNVIQILDSIIIDVLIKYPEIENIYGIKEDLLRLIEKDFTAFDLVVTNRSYPTIHNSHVYKD